MIEKLGLIAAVVGYVATIVGVITYLRRIWKSVKAEKDGVLCLLRSNIRTIYYHHCDEETPTIREYERQDLDDLYAGYHTLGGNHFVDDLYEKMRGWKVVT
jgi:hypothetical protein